MTGDQIQLVRNRLGMKKPAFAQLLGVNLNSVYRWEKDESPINSLAQRIVSALHAAPVGAVRRAGQLAKVNLERGRPLDALRDVLEAT